MILKLKYLGLMWLFMPVKSKWGHMRLLNVTLELLTISKIYSSNGSNDKRWDLRASADVLSERWCNLSVCGKKNREWGQQKKHSLTLQLFKTALQDVGILHLVYKGSWWETRLMFPRIKIHLICRRNARSPYEQSLQPSLGFNPNQMITPKE